MEDSRSHQLAASVALQQLNALKSHQKVSESNGVRMHIMVTKTLL